MSRRFEHSRMLIALAASCAAMTACAGTGNLATDGANPVVARINGEAVRQGDVDQWLKDDWLSEIAEDPAELYELRRAGIDGVIDNALLDHAAEKEGLSADAYLDEKTAELGPVTDEEIDEFYRRNKDRIRPAQPLEQLRPRIRTFLEADRPVRVITALRETAEVEILIEPPPAPRVARQQIPIGSASRGPIDAPIRIVEFSDYQCPFCRQAEDTIHQLEALYPGMVRFEYRHLPLGFHDNAIPAAKAAICAGAQDRFWDYHELLFTNQRQLGSDHLRRYAKQLDLEMEGFSSCLEAPETLAQVNADVALAASVGAEATPTFFVNGITVRGAQPTDAFRTIIDRELAQRAAAP